MHLPGACACMGCAHFFGHLCTQMGALNAVPLRPQLTSDCIFEQAPWLEHLILRLWFCSHLLQLHAANHRPSS